MIALVVTVVLTLGGAVAPPEITPGPFTYSAQQWPTKEACEAFVASDEGKASLNTLLSAVKESVNENVEVTLNPECQ